MHASIKVIVRSKVTVRRQTEKKHKSIEDENTNLSVF